MGYVTITRSAEDQALSRSGTQQSVQYLGGLPVFRRQLERPAHGH